METFCLTTPESYPRLQLSQSSLIWSTVWRAYFQNLLHQLQHVTHLHYWLPFAIKIDKKYSSLIKYIPIVGYFYLTFSTHTVYKVIKSGNEWHAEVDGRGFGIKENLIPLYVYISWQGQKAVLTIVEFAFVDFFYSKFQLVLIFPFAVNFVLTIGYFAVTCAANE